MPLREALGLSSGNYAQIPIHALRFPKKPCGSAVSSSFLPPKFAARNRQEPRLEAKKRPAKINPLFLFYCGFKWHKQAETSAGWELVQAMRSNNLGARALAAELLSETEDGRLLVRDLRRTRNSLTLITQPDPKTAANMVHAGGDNMNTPYGLPTVENCMTCPLKQKGWFCHLPNDLMRPFHESSHLATYPGGAILFVEGQVPRGAFVLCSGKVKLSTTSKEGKVLVLKIAEPGEVIGLSAVLAGESHVITAETLEPSLVNFVDRQGLLRLMERSGELGLRSAQAVSREFQYAYREIHELVLARSSSGKLARLLLSWVNSMEPRTREVRIHAPVTHEEMAQRIGASRETVTRLLSELRRKDLIKLEGATLIIKNRNALEAMAM
ncbi:MAG TPA: Crp/Fnr family transcriptional regulator [Terriglobales bacterium]|nr:Crp/Fnr family transcriptional regulator [Terriglobales bacterium]